MQKKELKKFDVEKKIQFDGFYLTRGHYSSGATFHDAKTGKIILRTLRKNVTCLAPWLTMLRHQAAENSVITSGAAKKYFSPREIIVIAGF